MTFRMAWQFLCRPMRNLWMVKEAIILYVGLVLVPLSLFVTLVDLSRP